jgi:AcrR family transcriptional regulator
MSSQAENQNSNSSPGRDRPRKHSGTSEAETAILKATAGLLAEVPLHELSVAQIITAAEVSRATFYFYFSSKFAVLADLVEHAIAEIYEASRPALDRVAGAPIEVALHQRIERSARVWATHRPVLQAAVENWHVFPELRTVWLEMLDGLADAIRSEIDRERAAGRAPDGPDSKHLAVMLAWATERCLYISGLGLLDSLEGEEDTVEGLSRIWLAAIYGRVATDARAAA